MKTGPKKSKLGYWAPPSSSFFFSFLFNFTRDCRPGRDCWSWPAPADDPVAKWRSRGTWRCEWRQRDRPDPWTGPKWRDCIAVLPRRTPKEPRILPWSRSGRDVMEPPGRGGPATKHLPSANLEWPSIPTQMPIESVVDATLWPIPLPFKLKLIK